MTFIKTAVKRPGANFCEKLGRYFLAPARLLWNGKTIKFKENGKIKIKDSFNPEQRTLLNKLFSSLALPIAIPIGVLFKAISLLSKEARLRNQGALIVIPIVQALLDEENATFTWKGLSCDEQVESSDRGSSETSDSKDDKGSSESVGKDILTTGSKRDQVDPKRAPQLTYVPLKGRKIVTVGEAFNKWELIESAAVDALQELYNEGHYEGKSIEELRYAVASLLIVNLFKGAQVVRTCLGDKIHFNAHISETNPESFTIPLEDGKEKELYQVGIFNRIDMDLDLITVKKNIDALDGEKLKTLKDLIYENKLGETQNASDEKLTEIITNIDGMTEVIVERYFESFDFEVEQGQAYSRLPDLSTESDETPYDTASNIYEIMETAFGSALQDLANEGTITAGNIDDAWVSQVVCERAFLDLLLSSRLEEEENIACLLVSKYVIVLFEFIMHEDGTIVTVPNDLTSSIMENAESVDREAVEIKGFLDTLNDEELRIFKNLMKIEVIGRKAERAADKQIELYLDKEGIEEERQEEMQKALTKLNKLALFGTMEIINARVFNKASTDVEFPEKPVIEEQDLFFEQDSSPLTDREDSDNCHVLSSQVKVKQDPQKQYLPKNIQRGIKKTPRVKERTIIRPLDADEALAHYLDTENELYRDTDEIVKLVKKQFSVKKNKDHSLSCFYGVCAQAFYKKGLLDKSRSHKHTLGLKIAVSKYIADNWQQFRGEVAIGWRSAIGSWAVAKSDSEEDIKKAIVRRAQHVVSDWASDVEIKAMAHIFGRPIYLIDCSTQELQIGEKGEILPSRIFGDQFDAEPVWILFIDENHFVLAEPK